LNKEKHDIFQQLAKHLAGVLSKRYACIFNIEAGNNQNRFAIRSDRTSSPYYEIELSTFEQLAVAISDGVHVQSFIAVVELSHCTRQGSQGWDFDYQAVERAAIRLIDLGVEFYREYEESLNSTKQLIGAASQTEKSDLN
jgi:hypothetical protein